MTNTGIYLFDRDTM